MKILILGGGGMLGHKLVQTFHQSHEVAYTTRSPLRKDVVSTFSSAKAFTGLDALEMGRFVQLIRSNTFDVVINCIGIVKQLEESKNAIRSISINALFPHQIAKACREEGVKFIQISTDCVFSGNKGQYTEADLEDARDLYGRTKLLGEVDAPALTLRTSIIGHELHSHRSLIDWFLSQDKGIKGFTNAIYTGVPTIELAYILRYILKHTPHLEGLYHVSSPPIDKCSLLKKVAQQYGHTIPITPHDDFRNDKSLVSQRFFNATNYVVPDWDTLIARMYQDYLEHQKIYIS